MYTTYFGLTETPFSITPDPRYLYLSPRHREALGHLVYGIKETGGFVCLTGEVGTGKTTVTRALLEQLPDEVDIAMILNPRMTVAEFLAAICDELRVSYPAKNRSVKVFVDALNEYLLHAHAQNRRVVLIIDEAQNLIAPVLEQVRLLTNLETAKTKLLQIVLVGQPELNDLLSRKELRQLAQRITARYHLQPLSLAELGEYVAHRLHVAGSHRNVFSNGAVRSLWMMSGGIPRIVNVICDRALLGAYARSSEVVTAQIVKRAGQEVRGELAELPGAPDSTPTRKWRHKRSWVMGGSAATVAGLLLIAALLKWGSDDDYATATAPIQPVTSQNATLTIQSFPQLSIDKWIEQNEQPTAAAMQSSLLSLLAIWNVPVSGANLQEKPCAIAGRHELKCVTGQGDLDMLKQVDRPVLLYLRSPVSGKATTAVLRHLLDQEGLLYVSESRQFRVSLQDIQQHWTGDYLYIWREPAGYLEPISLGSRGKVVSWVRERLFVIDGVDFGDSDTSEIFDIVLSRNVKRFQLKYGLEPDGIVGPQTLMLMNALSSPKTIPRLATTNK